ncbi:conserved unknown protein [Ectocarpus siliculosus]|uniref:Gem-associated protein 2 n=1 Tax=Ectocarpus siliculosus TaxID=2880 RepID=D7FMN9_ECTSI|nr:conserved unknown protein [Ectocarpus siliculosus]|eukprot:CBJ25936.1 conserved unknown protein [Ectocarpus siliculosus]
MERPALFVGDAEEGEATLKESETLYMPSTEPVPACPEYLLPSEEWELEVLSTFVDLRQYMRRWKATAAVSPAEREPVPALKDSTGWHIFCLGYADQEEEDDEEVVESAVSGGGGSRDPRRDDDAQSTYCTAPVESSAMFDMFSATLGKATAEEEREQGRDGKPRSPSSATTATAVPTVASASTTASGDAQIGQTERRTGREWLRTHPHGTPPTMRLAMQFDQVLTQKVLAFHADWLRDHLLSRARAVWIYTLLACLEKPLGSETAALVREILRRCCSQRAEVESPLDDNLPALNIITAITGRFFQQAEVA